MKVRGDRRSVLQQRRGRFNFMCREVTEATCNHARTQSDIQNAYVKHHRFCFFRTGRRLADLLVFLPPPTETLLSPIYLFSAISRFRDIFWKCMQDEDIGSLNSNEGRQPAIIFFPLAELYVGIDGEKFDDKVCLDAGNSIITVHVTLPCG